MPRRSRRLACGVALLGSLLALCAARAEAPRFGRAGPEIEVIVGAIRAQRPLSARSVGTSSIVFRLDLEGPIDAAFRPESRLHPRGHLAEIAAFRLARSLGLDNVAPVVPRSLPLAELGRLVRAADPIAWEEVESDLVPRGGQLSGAVIYWIPTLRELGFDTPSGVERFTSWLAQDTEQPPDAALAAEISDMLAFDYLIGNVDRFSGANLQGDADARQLFLRDHNLAFREPFRALQHRRVVARLKRAQRFSRRFVAALKGLPDQDLSGVLADPLDSPDAPPVLSDAQLQGVRERRRALLSYVAALIDNYGESNVLTFP